MIIDYSKILQPQTDGYDVTVFQQIKAETGFVNKVFPDIPKRFDNKIYIHSWKKNNLPQAFIPATDVRFNLLEEHGKLITPIEWNSITNLVDVLTTIACPDGNEFSCQHAAYEYPGAWIVMAPITNNPSVIIRNMLHEMTHWKLTALGFGKGVTPTSLDMLEHDNQFVLNPVEELHHSIVNSYPDTAQPAVGNKPTGRPISASIHAYASFIGEAQVALRFAKYDIQRYHNLLRYAKKWGDRLDESLEALMLGAKTTPNGAQLLLGLYRWTKEYQEEYKDAINTLSKLL